MKMTSQNVHWLFILLMIIAPLFYAWYTHYQRNHFTCESHLIIVDENSRVDTLMTFTFNNGTGSYDSTGEYSQAGQEPVAISNKIAFRYWREEGRVIMISSDTNERPKKDEPFRHAIPDFFRQRDHGISIQIVPVNASAYLFIFGNTPAFYCAKG
ncbi:hypothetical protein [Enterobacter sp. 168J2]|uniref:hypothetical protein n=1 Tax=Enterobacter sp. 168J2 TaxID=3077758 RepID=UPI0020A0C7D4|nr:hypothetical protein [Enterobacter sp. 168J2]MCP1112863.1 hypothetical protein [Enterobacter bugandensis]HBU6130998.1 hypothetical protein [Enterobacter cloacae]